MVLPPELVGLIDYLPTLSESVRRVVLAISAMTVQADSDASRGTVDRPLFVTTREMEIIRSRYEFPVFYEAGSFQPLERSALPDRFPRLHSLDQRQTISAEGL